MRLNVCTRVLSVLCALTMVGSVRTVAGELRAEQFLPDNTVAAFLVSDLAGARAAAQKTQMGEMFSQPEMQAFLNPAIGAIQTQYDAMRQKNPLLPAWADVDGGLLSGEVAIGVYGRPKDARDPVGVVVSLLPKDPAAFKRLLPEPMRGTIVDGFKMPLGMNPTDPVLLVAGSRLLFCAPGTDAPMLLERLKEEGARAKNLAATPEFKLAREKCAKSVALFYASPSKAVELIVDASAHNAAADTRAPLAVLQTLGLDKIESLTYGVGFTATEPIIESFTAFKEAPKEGLFALFSPAGPIAPDAFKIAAADAPYAGAFYFDIAGLMPLIKKTAAAADPNAQQGIAMLEMLAQQNLGIDLEKELLANMGGHIVFAQTPMNTAAPLSFSDGVVLAIPIKNPEQVERALGKLGTAFNTLMKGVGENDPFSALSAYKALPFDGGTIHYLKSAISSQGAFMVRGNTLLVGNSIYTIRRTVEQTKKNSTVLENKDFQATIARVSGKPFDAKALPQGFAYSTDASSGTGTLVMTGIGLAGATVAVAALTELPVPPTPGEKQPVPTVNPQVIKRNESQSALSLQSLAEAQEIYKRTDYDKDDVLEYALNFKGAHSLFETEPETGDLELIDEQMANAGGEPGPETNHSGYRFKLLKGSDTTDEFGGKKAYAENGNLVHGFAYIAYPAAYNVTGTKTFQMSSAGMIFAKDLGEKTLDIVAKQDAFNVNDTWESYEPDYDVLFAGGEEPWERIMKGAGGKTALAIVSNVDLGLWPDEQFFVKYRRSAGMYFGLDGKGWYGYSDLPGPSPRNSIPVETITVAGVAIVAAVAIPSLLRSRMAANETAAAAACKAIGMAQEIFHRTDYDNDGVLEYAQAMKGDQSLFELKAGGEPLALIDMRLAGAEAGTEGATPKAGYYFKILKAQSALAPGGQKSYIVKGNMTLGYAVLAYPAQYDNTGRNCFLVNSAGTIFQRDFGPATAQIVSEITEYNPEEEWIPAE